jgi:hypothetical protein
LRIVGSIASRPTLYLIFSWHLSSLAKRTPFFAMVARIGPTLGPQAIVTLDPHSRPLRPKKSPAPRVHAASKRARQELIQAYRLFVSAFRSAAEKLPSRTTSFPTVFHHTE